MDGHYQVQQTLATDWTVLLALVVASLVVHQAPSLSFTPTSGIFHLQDLACLTVPLVW